MRIVSASISTGNILLSLPPPARHKDILEASFREFGPLQVHLEKGFLTDDGHFVYRDRAFLIATAAGQIKEKVGHPGKLFSEDLW